jgi:glycosyltransferase involved in cell wall biosynthesis
MRVMKQASKHLLICNERLLFRFGVDRILVETAKMFVEFGWRVTFVCHRCDRNVLEAITPRIFVAPGGGDLYDHEAICGKFVEGHWGELSVDGAPDAILVGGWPFFNLAAFAERKGVASLFIDAGAVPHDGFGDNDKAAQRAVRRLRAMFLPHFDLVLPISEFIRESQTIPDRGSSAGVEVVLLGADHLTANVYQAAERQALEEERLVVRLETLSRYAIPLVLNLGRFEEIGYKNSKESFDLIRLLLARRREAGATEPRLLVLGDETRIPIPADLANYVICLGFPSDATLTRIMRIASVGFSPSLWEGFNLPIGEMQILDKPVFAYNVGAHPEVILHPWFLCANIEEACRKIVAVLSESMPKGVFDRAVRDDYRERFSWRRALASYRDHVTRLVEIKKAARTKPKLLFVDITGVARGAASAANIRAAKRLWAELANTETSSLLPVVWNEESYTFDFANGDDEAVLAGGDGPRSGFGGLNGVGAPASPDNMLHHLITTIFNVELLIPESALDGEAEHRVEWAKKMGVRTSAVFHDLGKCDDPSELATGDVECRFHNVAALTRMDTIFAPSSLILDSLREAIERLGLRITGEVHVGDVHREKLIAGSTALSTSGDFANQAIETVRLIEGTQVPEDKPNSNATWADLFRVELAQKADLLRERLRSISLLVEAEAANTAIEAESALAEPCPDPESAPADIDATIVSIEQENLVSEPPSDSPAPSVEAEESAHPIEADFSEAATTNFDVMDVMPVDASSHAQLPEASVPEAAQADSATDHVAWRRKGRERRAYFLRRLFNKKYSGLTAKQVRSTGLFDAEWYLRQYPDVRAAAVDPLSHFIEHGHLEHRSPGPAFDTNAYLNAHPWIALSDLSPFQHFMKTYCR